MKRVGRGGLEPEVQVELPGLVVQGMDEQRPHTDDLRRGDGAGDRVPEQMGAQAPALFLGVDGEASEQDDRDRVGHALPDAPTGIQPLDGTGGQGVVADDAFVPGSDEAAGCPRGLVAQRASAQPVVERGFAAVQGRQVVGGDDWPGGRVAAHSKSDSSANRRSSRGLRVTGRSRTARNSAHASFPRVNMRWSARTSLALATAAFTVNSVTLEPSTAAAARINASCSSGRRTAIRELLTIVMPRVRA